MPLSAQGTERRRSANRQHAPVVEDSSTVRACVRWVVGSAGGRAERDLSYGEQLIAADARERGLGQVQAAFNVSDWRERQHRDARRAIRTLGR